MNIVYSPHQPKQGLLATVKKKPFKMINEGEGLTKVFDKETKKLKFSLRH